MTDTEKQELRDLKQRTVDYLRGIPDLYERYREALADTDQRLEDYVRGVIDNPDGHNVYEILKIKRFFDLVDKYTWNGVRVRKKIALYEKLKFSGTTGRRSYKLTPVQTFQIAHIFGLDKSEDRRLIRLTYLFVPRKFSKTTFAAFLAVDDFLFGNHNAEAYVAANSSDQATKCFNEVREILKALPNVDAHLRINQKTIFYIDGGRESLVRCLASDVSKLDGLHPSLAVIDEYAQARNTASKDGADIKTALTSGMGPRLNPLTVIITTASDVLDGPCYEEIEFAKAVLRGEKENDSMFADLFMPDVDDEDGDPNTWHKVQPHLGVTVQDDFYDEEWKTAQMSASNMLAFRTKLLNRFVVNEIKTWFTIEHARSLLGNFDINHVHNHQTCVVAFDLSIKDDFSAVSYTIREMRLQKFFVHTDYYFPKGSLASHPNRALYESWAEHGYLKLCEGNVIDQHQIAADIIRRGRDLKIMQITYDSFHSPELVNILINSGGRKYMTPYSQKYSAFSKAVDVMESIAFCDPPKIEFNNNPINSYCLANCVIDHDSKDEKNSKPIKYSPTRKIDGAITALMTIGSFVDMQIPKSFPLN